MADKEKVIGFKVDTKTAYLLKNASSLGLVRYVFIILNFTVFSPALYLVVLIEAGLL